MAKRIREIAVVNHRLYPVVTELRLFVEVENLTSTTEIKGNLHGPRCVYATTIEIAYGLREVARGDRHIELRVTIPEPAWWEPETPFLYRGSVQLWQDKEPCERVEISHGIRMLQLSPKGLKLNGKPFVLRGRVVDRPLTEQDANKMREAGINALLATVSDSGIDLCNAADRLGFFVLATSNEFTKFTEHRDPLAIHPSTFGWIFNRYDFSAGASDEAERPFFYGVNTSAANAPANADFLVCHENELAWLEDVPLPKIVVAKGLPEPLPKRAGVIGWIELPTV